MYCLEFAGEDDPFAAREAAAAAATVEPVAPGLAVARGVDHRRVRTLAYTHAASALVARTDASLDGALTALELANLDPEGTVAVRARDVRGLTGVSTSEVERELGQVLVDRGFDVDLDDPDHELRALFSAGAVDEDVGASDGDGGRDADSDGAGDRVGHGDGDGDGVCVLGWLEAESVRDYGDRRPTDRPFFQPGSMAPMDARALANVAGAGPGRTLLDPMCGTGGVLIEAGLVGAGVLGVDAQAKMAHGARENLEAYLEAAADTPAGIDPGDFAVVRGDATALGVRDRAVDAVVFDAPYGRQSKVARHDLGDLVAGALAEAHRVSAPDATAVLVADRSWRDAAVAAGWRLDARFERRVHRSLVRHVHVLEKEP